MGKYKKPIPVSWMEQSRSRIGKAYDNTNYSSSVATFAVSIGFLLPRTVPAAPPPTSLGRQ